MLYVTVAAKALQGHADCRVSAHGQGMPPLGADGRPGSTLVSDGFGSGTPPTASDKAVWTSLHACTALVLGRVRQFFFL